MPKKTSQKKEQALPDPDKLLAWYDRHARVLPWRAPPGQRQDPYVVWLSEIMLQQTTVVTVKPYFEKFLDRWPRLEDLAAAKLDDVLQAWAGLGYYRRARGLHACAQVIVGSYRGRFPEDEKELARLPGLGPYTAAAVAAIAFDKRACVVDGNVERVVARVFAVDEPLPKGKKTLRAFAATLLPDHRWGDFAQAMMDLGASVCTPRAPKCGLCPWAGGCRLAFSPEAEAYPARAPKADKPLRRGWAFVLFDEQGRVYLQKRPETGLFAGMMEVPSSAWEEGAMPDFATLQPPVKAKWQPVNGIVRHSFTHFDLEMGVAVANLSRGARLSGGKWVAWGSLQDEALPSLMRKILRFAAR